MTINKREVREAIQLVEWHREYLMQIGLHPTQTKKRNVYLQTNKYNKFGIEDIKFFSYKASKQNQKVCKELKLFIRLLSNVDSICEVELSKKSRINWNQFKKKKEVEDEASDNIS
tara:strand:- start:3208 stop:3552 length:345 start_codon:yes stop_codon:yes gene_type:complete